MAVDGLYLGDGVYASADGYMIKLTTDRTGGDGVTRTETIWLEPQVYAALRRYAQTLGFEGEIASGRES